MEVQRLLAPPGDASELPNASEVRREPLLERVCTDAGAVDLHEVFVVK